MVQASQIRSLGIVFLRLLVGVVAGTGGSNKWNLVSIEPAQDTIFVFLLGGGSSTFSTLGVGCNLGEDLVVLKDILLVLEGCVLELLVGDSWLREGHVLVGLHL